MALEKIALNETTATIFQEYRRVLGSNSSYEPVQITKLATIFFLSTTFSEIIRSITQKFSDFGHKEKDQIAVNMAIPVASISNDKVRSLFEKILNISWQLGQGICVGKNNFPIDDLLLKVDDLERDLKKEDSELCHVYPEVSANVQAFIRSPASSPDVTTIYFFSDTGAGTVDQSIFTYAGGTERRLNYFSAGIFPRGSSQIEIIACGNEVTEKNLEYWRKEKEFGHDSPRLNYAKMKVSGALESDSDKTLRDTLKCLPFGVGGISPQDTLKNKMKFIFSGGGHIKFPYQNALIAAYKKLLRTGQDPILTSIARPNDLDITQGYEDWINRLYVAYGLSFLFDELAENTFPSKNKLNPEVTIATKSPVCTCMGRNKNCSKCFGIGIVH